MPKSPPLSDDGVYLVLAVLFVLVAGAVCAIALISWGLFLFILAVLSPLWETVGVWWGIWA
jgi:hypothetical protein